MIVTIARWTQKNLRKLAADTNAAQLLTVPYSHYCEFARWTLEANGVAYDEHGYPPGGHVLPALSLRLGGNEKHLSNSSKVQAVGKPPRRTHATAVPAVVMPTGNVFADSWQAAEALFPPEKIRHTEGLKEFLDQRIGILTRQFVYISLFRPDNDNVWDGLCYEDGGFVFKIFWRLGLKGWLTSQMQNTFQTNNEIENKKCLDGLLDAFEHIDRRWLEGIGEGEYLGGTEPCMEDYAMASLCAPVILPRWYCGGQYAHFFDKLMEQDSEFSSIVHRLRDTKCGKHSMNMYNMHRSRSGLRALL